MRYVGLVVLGLVLWAGQASAERVSDERALLIVVNGKTIGEHYKTVEYEGISSVEVRTSRVVFRTELFICNDWLPPQSITLKVRCFGTK